MNKNTIFVTAILLILTSFQEGYSQSNISTYTPSKLLKDGQIDVKWFNNFYSETESTFSPEGKDRENYYTSTFEFFRGVTDNSRLNVGVILTVRSNNVGGKGWFTPLEFSNESGVSRAGIGAVGPTISYQPFSSIGNLSMRTSFHIPLFDQESKGGVFFDKKSYVWENRVFYDKTLAGGMFQVFSDLGTQLNLGRPDRVNSEGKSIGSWANNSLGLPVSVFFSYFPIDKFTVFVQGQQYFQIDLGESAYQDFTQLGIGVKYQITQTINLETSYTNFVRGSDTGLGETINFGVRFLSNAY